MAWGVVDNQMLQLIEFYYRSKAQENLQLKIKILHKTLLAFFKG